MKNIKKLLSIVMVLTLVLALGAQAFAATVTIAGPGDHTYHAYKVFSGTTTTIDDHEKLASIEWANEAGSAELLTKLAAAFEGKFKAGMTAEEAAEVISGLSEAEARELGRVLIENKSLLADAGEVKNGTDLAPGYYAIEDSTDPLAPADSRNAIVLEVVGSDVTVNSKHDVPSSEKKVKDVNDSTDGVETGWVDSADWDIGDDVPYQLKATLPKNMNEYATYYLEFVDNLSKGLTYNNDAKIYFVQGGEKIEITGSFKITSSEFEGSEPAYAGGTVVLMECTDLKVIEALAGKDLNGAQIVVEYSAELDADAVIGAAGNPNRMHIVFSNNPGGEGHGATPDDTVIVFTYDVDVNKIDEDNEPLEGATFALYKVVQSDDEGAVEAATVEQLKDIEGLKGKCVKALDIKVQEDGVTFYSKGIDDGEYWLVETKAPDGYNAIEPKKLLVTATHTEGDAPELSDLSDTNGVVTFDHTKTGGTAGEAMGDATIQNHSGLELPETGGIGTTIFYVVGGILVVGAVILLVTKRRVSGAEK